jgi:hypothetical protein
VVCAYTRIAFDNVSLERGHMSGEVNPVPEGFHTVTPYMTIKDASAAIEFYKEAFGATEIFRWADPDGRVRHARKVSNVDATPARWSRAIIAGQISGRTVCWSGDRSADCPER